MGLTERANPINIKGSIAAAVQEQKEASGNTGMVLDAGDPNTPGSTPSYLKLKDNKVELLNGGKTGFTISEMGVKKSGTQTSSGLPTAQKGTMWEDNLLQMTFIPSTSFTPISTKVPRNPLSYLTQLAGF